VMLTPRMSAAAAVVALTSCLATPNSNASAADTTAPASLSIGIAPAPDNLDPGASGLAVDGWVSINVNASLLYDYQGKLYPGLVTKWTPSADDKTWRLELRKGVKFQDGTPFNAAAVKASFDHVVDPATKSRAPLAMLGPYAGATIVDDYTIEINFKQPNAGFQYAMANVLGGMNSPTALKAAGSPAEYARKPVGAGPYKIDSFVFNQQITLSAFDDFNWAPEFMGASGPALVKKLTMRILPDAKARANALRTGELAIAGAIEPQDAVSLKSAGFKVTPVDAVGMPYGLFINVDKFPTDDVNVRRALILATDQKQMINTLFDDQYVPATQLLTPNTEGYDETLKTLYSTNLEKANQLLDQAGWKMGSDGVREKDGKKLELQMINIAAFGFDQIAQLLQAQVKKAGFSVKITAESFPTVAATMNAGKQNIGDFFYFDLDARDALYATLDSTQIKSGFNWAHYSNPKLDALLAKANSDSSGREQAIKDAQKIAMDDAVFIPLYDLRQLWATNKDVSGVKFTQSGAPLFYTAK
jgi:peptide/nickel transport system substrate-binding protein